MPENAIGFFKSRIDFLLSPYRFVGIFYTPMCSDGWSQVGRAGLTSSIATHGDHDIRR